MKFISPEEALNKVWGYNKFRPLQAKIIESLMQKHDTLALLPTGGGKSLCYQVPALCMEGICIVVSPLIALMKDQVDQLEKLGLKAYAIHSGLSAREIDIILDNCIYGKIKYLYVSPERLKSNLFLERVKKMNVSILAIDEAHCISQWGFDFRPSYLQIKEFKPYIPDASMIALTATATQKVVKDILQELSFSQEHQVFIQSFARPNLSLIVRKSEDKEAKLLEILNKIKGQSIVYTRTRKTTKEISNFLLRNHISADYYHAGLDQQERIRKQELWMNNGYRVMVATNAFGMGINKPDVRIVVHMDLNNNLESYYQEAGRAGRDGIRSYAIILYHSSDIEGLKERNAQSSPRQEVLRKVYQSLANFFKIAVGSSQLSSFDFDLNEFVNTYKLDFIITFHALKKLEEQGFIQLTDSFYHPSKLMILIDHLELYKFQVAQKQYEPITKALLRIYGGELYHDFVTISEKKMAFILKTSIPEIEKKLTALNSLNIIIYDKQKDKPQVTFITPRFDANKLPLNIAFLEERAKNDLLNIEAVIDYVHQKTECRANFIQDYFGEKNLAPCKCCDVCLENKISIAPARDIQEIAQLLVSEIVSNPMTSEDLMEVFPSISKSEIFEALQMLLESEEIYFDENIRFHRS